MKCASSWGSHMILQALFCWIFSACQEPDFAEPIRNETVPEGRDVKLACTVRNLGTYKVAWIHYEKSAILSVGNHVITRNPRITVSHDHHRTWYLHIHNVQEGDRGRYQCQLNTVQAKTQAGYLHVVVPPVIEDAFSSSDVIAREGSDVSLTCHARGSPPPVVKWKREDGRPILLNKTTSVAEMENTVLDLSKISRLSMGVYLCIASNGVPPAVSKRLQVSVDFPPMVWVPHQLVGAPLGATVTLECLLEAHPAALHYWSRADGVVLHDPQKYHTESATGAMALDAFKRRGEVLPNNSNKVTFNWRNDPQQQTTSLSFWSSPSQASYTTHLRLTIRHITMKDYGAYRCVAKNPRGETDGTIKLYHVDEINEQKKTVKAPSQPSAKEGILDGMIKHASHQYGSTKNPSSQLTQDADGDPDVTFPYHGSPVPTPRPNDVRGNKEDRSSSRNKNELPWPVTSETLSISSSGAALHISVPCVTFLVMLLRAFHSLWPLTRYSL